jgi:diguanylate cyclase (GGDEF)-like protein/PAS domain S-box-containing protein
MLASLSSGYFSRHPFTAKLLIIASAYYIGGRLGLAIPYVGSLITLFWLPTGIAVAALMRWGWRCWPGVYLGAFLVNFSISSSCSVSLGIAIGNTLAPLLAAWLLRFSGFNAGFDRPKDIPLFCLAAFAGMLVSALGGTSVLLLVGALSWDTLPGAFLAWWLGDSVGVLLAAPFFLTFTRNSLEEFRQRHSELLIWSIATGILGWIVFFSDTGANALPLAYLPLPFAVWAALRFGPTGASLSMMVLSFLAAWSTSIGRGPFAQFETHQGLFLLWAYMSTLVLAGLMITALLAARKHAEGRANLLLESVSNGVWGLDTNGNTTFVNTSASRMLGYTQEELIGKPMHAMVHHSYPNGSSYPRDKCPMYATFVDGINRTVTDEVLWRKDGSNFFVEYNAHPIYSDKILIGTVVVFQDITARKHAEQMLQESQSRFASIIGSAMDAIITIDAKQNIIFFNSAAERAFGYAAHEIIGQPVERLIPSRFHAHHRQHVEAFGRTGIPARSLSGMGALFGLHANGEEFPIEASISQVKIAGETNSTMILRDISERTASERKIGFLTQIYAALSRTNQALIESTDEITLFNKICEITVEFGGLKLAWIGINDEQSGVIKPLAMYGSNQDYLSNIIISSRASDPAGHGPTGTAFRENRPIFVQDFKTDPMLNHWREHITNYGWGSLGAVPIIRAGNVYAMMTFYHTEAHIFSPEIIDLLNEMGRNIGRGLDRFDLEEAKHKSQESMQLAAAIYQSSAEAIMVTDENNLITDVNPAFSTITGYTLEEVIGQNPKLLQSGRHDKEFYQAMWQSIINTNHWQGELWDRRKDGELHAKLTNISIIRHADGSVYRHVAQFLDITDKKQKEELIWKQANFDTLTNLPNRRMFSDRLEQEMKKAHRAAQPLALLFIDLDRFKEINDTLGHAKGDVLLIEAANRLSLCVRATDTVARLGGDEFTVVLPDFGERIHLERIAQDIIHTLVKPFDLGSGDIAYISASIGITVYPDDAQDIESLLKHADQAMYVAKAEGRNRFSYFTESMQQEAREKLALTTDLRLALARNELHVYYQPILELGSGRITKAEALLRWKHPTRGMVSPVAFIPLAEESGLIHEIGEWVFQQAIASVAHWHKQCGCFIQVSVNKSPVQFEQSDSRPWAIQINELGLPKNGIAVEITEGLLLKESSKAKQQLLEFRNSGIEVSIDDFGTGFSSLSYLKQFDIDYLKIDRSFVMDLELDKDDKALVEAIIVMAHKLGIKTIAEGVETVGQRDLLKSFGCDYVQGFLYSPAVPTAEFEKMISRQVI